MKIHNFSDTGEAYDCTQCGVTYEGDTEIAVTNGDILIIDTEQVVGIAGTWPFAVTVAHGELHSLNDGVVDPKVVRDFGPKMVRAVGQAALRGWPVRENILAIMSPVQKLLRCSCCGGYTTGRQWSNRDTGYGLCNNCIDDCVPDPLEFLHPNSGYGVPGYHYDIDGTHYREKQLSESKKELESALMSGLRKAP